MPFDISGFLSRIGEGLLKAIRLFAPPLCFAGILYLFLPFGVLRAIGLPPSDPLAMKLAGVAVLVLGSVVLFLPPVWLAYFVRARRKSAKLWWQYFHLSARAKLHLGPAATGRAGFFHVAPDDEDAQSLVDKGLWHVDLLGGGWMRGRLTEEGTEFVEKFRRTLRQCWNAPENLSATTSILRSNDHAGRIANGRV